MNCDVNVHDYLKEDGEIICPFCGIQLGDVLVTEEVCCENMNLIKDNGANVCGSCGSVHGYDLVNEYIDFYDNMYQIRRKSVYHREYHLRNRIDFLSSKNEVQITFKDKEKIIRIFCDIDKILPQINGNRKRMINIDFILKKIYKMMDIQEKYIKITKSKKTLAFYEKYWKDILLLIGDEIQSVISK